MRISGWSSDVCSSDLLRAYVGKDGKPAPYSKDNVPFQTESWLTVSQEPLEAGDYVMVTGYPGRTNRYRLANEGTDAIEWEYQMLVDYPGDYPATDRQSDVEGRSVEVGVDLGGSGMIQ